ncbi:coenzyme F420-0:L-glutamate ligase [Microgenomates group bacterium]|nr:coenzyme F420-0:L-glutamate ligase [Microgenomates group bacterium]
MQVNSFRSPLVKNNDDLYQVLEQTLPKTLAERSVIAVSSKIISLCQGRAIPIPEDPQEARRLKDELVIREADRYHTGSRNFGIFTTLKNNILIPSSGIDESNTGGFFLLWPSDVHAVAADLWQWLRSRYGIDQIGVVITDSRCILLKWGVLGIALSWAGFQGVRSKIGELDLFGKPFTMTKINDAESLAAAAVYEMGETNEQTPLAIITDLPQLIWQNHPPTPEELRESYIEPADDIFGSMIEAVDWKAGEK